MRFKIGLQLNCLRLPTKRALQLAAHLGADAIEIDARGEIRPSTMTATGLRQFRKLLEDLRLKVCGVGFQTRRGYHVVEDLERRIAATKQAMDFAYALGCNVVNNQIGHIPEADDPARDILLEALTDIGRYGQHCGAFLAARTGSEDPDQLCALINQLPDGSLFVSYDPGNLIVNGFSASDCLSQFGRNIIYVHARDGVRDLARGRGLEVPLGQGTVDFPLTLATLEQLGYGGFLTVDRQQSQNPVADVGDAIAYLREVQ